MRKYLSLIIFSFYFISVFSHAADIEAGVVKNVMPVEERHWQVLENIQLDMPEVDTKITTFAAATGISYFEVIFVGSSCNPPIFHSAHL